MRQEFTLFSESHILEFVEAFGKFDEAQTGLVSTKELGNLLRHLGISPTKEELQVIFSSSITEFN